MLNYLKKILLTRQGGLVEGSTKLQVKTEVKSIPRNSLFIYVLKLQGGEIYVGSSFFRSR